MMLKRMSGDRSRGLMSSIKPRMGSYQALTIALVLLLFQSPLAAQNGADKAKSPTLKFRVQPSHLRNLEWASSRTMFGLWFLPARRKGPNWYVAHDD
jgi:hypothetical protein